ncbi:hypothetical protein JD844_001383 [Phrynosoma platyrhinos]|uniref:Agouti signaling protein n=1 Tax=Phrynosoma platyrhinos TaxID=52577 RepID=A0ABQ7TAC4_PHRPL|nr:hypothetical protein JD844_001383 [Phrynosoma platyrhinos]
MATPSLNPPPDLPFAATLFLPLPAIVFLVVGSYLLLLVLVLVLRQCLLGWEPGTCSFPRLCPLCDCACTYQPPDCQNINCICFEIKLR